MKVLFTGNGGSGSWLIRGEQLSAALGASAIPKATEKTMRPFDVVYAVKRLSNDLVAHLRASKKPVVWDVVDAWPQPLGNTWGRDESLRWLSEQLRRIQPQLVIGATQAMVDDIRTLGYRSEVLYHHVRPLIRVNPIRRKIRVVGYEGSAKYVDKWGKYVSAACERRGWVFQKTDGVSDALHHFDVVLALRDFVGYAPKWWKSNVKLVNAMGSGTPFVGSNESGYCETACGVEYWANNVSSLEMSFDWLEPESTRQVVHDRFLVAAERFSLSNIALRLRGILDEM